nr:ABC transporter ATP-binding protein [uncultured Steroidobacter sp.]
MQASIDRTWMSQMLQMRGVVKHYTRGNHRVEVLHGVDLEARPGEFIALMGPSGSGKSTLLNLIAGLDKPDRGEVVVAGSHLNTLTQRELSRWRARHVGFVFQFYNLLPTLSAELNVEVPLFLTRLSRAQRRQSVAASLSLVGLTQWAKHKPQELSGGQQQRVAIARAIVSDPTILVCDEPTGDLDRATADEILQLLRTISTKHGKTIVMVTHDPLAAGYATRQLHVDKGLLIRSEERAIA